MTDSPTVYDRLRAAGLSDERITFWTGRELGAIRVDDEPARGDTPAPAGSRVVLRG